MSRTRKLDAVEIRVLGALLEKQQATPESYPLTTNGVIAACNQKTGRDPVTAYTETEVVEALDRLREDVLVWRNEAPAPSAGRNASTAAGGSTPPPRR